MIHIYIYIYIYGIVLYAFRKSTNPLSKETFVGSESEGLDTSFIDCKVVKVSRTHTFTSVINPINEF